MSYKTRRQYEIPKLVYMFDFKSLLDIAIDQVKEIDRVYIEFLLTFTYPNMEYDEVKRAGWKRRYKRLVEKSEKISHILTNSLKISKINSSHTISTHSVRPITWPQPER